MNNQNRTNLQILNLIPTFHGTLLQSALDAKVALHGPS
jgi:hypothetical protein